MPSGLYYEGTTFPVPHHVVNERIEQLKQVIPQFYSLENLFSRGRYLPHRWAFFCSKEMIKNNIVIFRIELLDMKNEIRVFRNWEVKANQLISDTKNEDKDPFVLTGALYIGWWQMLVGEGLLYQNNILLAKALEIGLRESPQKYGKTVVTSGNIRIRSIMGKTVQGFDFELYVDFSDERKLKPKSVKWVLDCDKDIKDGILIETEPESMTFMENSPNFKAEKDKMIGAVRDILIEDGKNVKSGDWVIDQYYISNLVLTKKGYKAVVSLVFMSQMGNTKLFEVNVERMGHEYTILKCEALVFDFSIVDFIEEKGDKFNQWQSFSKKSCVLYNPCIKKLAEVGALQQHGSKVVECTRAQCRVRRGGGEAEEENDIESGSFTGFDFIMIMRVRDPKGIVSTQEWKITGNPCGEEDYKLLGMRKFKPNRSVTPSMDMTALNKSKEMSRSPSPVPVKTETSVLAPSALGTSNRTPPPQRPTHRRSETEKRGVSNEPVSSMAYGRRRLPPPMRKVERNGEMDRTFENFAVDKNSRIMEVGKIRDFLGRSPRK